MENEKKYYLGLDIGTNSVGWCVTDRDYNIIKKRVKRYSHKDENGNPVFKTESVHLWGSRLFDDASDASGRRMARSSRRRLARRRTRIILLQDMFKTEMDKVDPYFFDRLNNSFFHKEDKPKELQSDCNCLLFTGKDFKGNPYTDRDYYKDYPTIYHLRQELINNPEKKDIRLVYLALAHMIKYRGNFLKETDINETAAGADNILSLFNDFDDEFSGFSSDESDTIFENRFNCTKKQADQLFELFKTESRKNDLLIQELAILGIKKSNTDIRVNLLKVLNGSSVSLAAIFPQFNDDEEISKIKIDCTSSDFTDTILPDLASKIGDDLFNIISTAVSFYDFRLITNILKGGNSLSSSMVEIYEEHHQDLKVLKDLVKRYARKEYASFFRQLEKGEKPLLNYANYVGMNKIKGKKTCVAHSTSKDDLYKAIRKMLPFDQIGKEGYAWKDSKDKALLEDIQKKMDSGKYLCRQNSRENSIFPYQLNKLEMNKIIENQGKYYPFLLEKEPDFNNPKVKSYKLDSLLEYKIPYYVGPLTNQDNCKNKWAVRKEGMQAIKITPWNFHDVIDEARTEEEFINNMKNSCTYIIGEETLPMNSLLYSKFMLLNEMNKWMINGSPITKEQKDYLIQNVYLKKAKPNIKDIRAALKRQYGEDTTLRYTSDKDSANDGEALHANLKPYLDMMAVFGENFYQNEELYNKAEEIIFDITILEDKKQVQERLSRMDLTNDQKKKLLSLNYKGWGKLSAKLLTGIKTEIVNNETGEAEDWSIMDIMEERPENFMQIYETSGKFDFKQQVEALMEESNLTPLEMIDEEYVSPLMKRALRQTLLIVEELKKILKIDSFDTYFVEATRRDDMNLKGKRILSRKRQLQDIYKSAKKYVSEELSAQLEKQDDDSLRSKKIFRYFLQLGKDVYTGEPIDLDELDKEYDIDHIIPQAIVKDDSINNTVLVRRTINTNKSDSYPLPKGTLTEKGREWIKTLNSIDDLLMSKNKMDRITRTYPLTEDEEASFVARQLTTTDQSVKAVCDILKKTDTASKIVYSKAGLVSDFRKFFNLIKCRDVNDFHHANDAYLNIVVGNVYNKVFTNKFTGEMIKRNKAYYESQKISAESFFSHDHTVFNRDTKIWKAKHYLSKDFSYKAEDPNSTGTIDLVRKYMSYNDPLVTQMLFTQKGKQGFFNKISIRSKTDGGATMPLKDCAPYNCEGFETKYGGYNDLTAPYFILVRGDIIKGKDKGKHTYSLENIPAVYLSKVNPDSEEDLERYFTEHFETYGITNPKVILKKVLIRSIVEFHKEIDGKDCHTRVGISGKTGNRLISLNFNELMVDRQHEEYIRCISKLLGNNLPFGTPKPDLTKYEKVDTIHYLGMDISNETNIEFFDYLCSKYELAPYKLLPEISNLFSKVNGQKEVFSKLSCLQQILVLNSLIRLLSCKNKREDLSSIKLTSTAGDQRFVKTLPPNTRLIAQSITGFYEKVLFEVPKD